MNDAPVPTLDQTWDEVWNLLQGLLERRGELRQYVTLASCDAEGAPQQRTVALRAVDTETARLTILTDLASHKVGEIRANPQVSVLTWHPEPQIQLRLNGRAEVDSGAHLRPLWEALPEASLLSYSHLPTPGAPIEASDAYAQIPDFERFARITVTLHQVDHVILAQTGHRRALFRRENGWQGQWRSP